MDNDELNFYRHKTSMMVKKTSLILRIMNFYAYLGALITVMAFGYLVFNTMQINLNSSERLALFFGIAGAFLSISSLALVKFRKVETLRRLEEFERIEIADRYLSTWSELERVILEASNDEKRSDVKLKSIRDAIKILRAENKINVIDTITFDELMQLRNSLVHNSNYISSNKIDESLKTMVSIITKLI